MVSIKFYVILHALSTSGLCCWATEDPTNEDSGVGSADIHSLDDAVGEALSNMRFLGSDIAIVDLCHMGDDYNILFPDSGDYGPLLGALIQNAVTPASYFDIDLRPVGEDSLPAGIKHYVIRQSNPDSDVVVVVDDSTYPSLERAKARLVSCILTGSKSDKFWVEAISSDVVIGKKYSGMDRL